jgi:hypothetical protein
MKVTKHIEQLLKQGHKPREIVELGFPKRVVTRVYRQLRKEKATSWEKESKIAHQEKTQVTIPPGSSGEIATIWQKVQSMANDLQRIDSLIQALSEASIIITAARKLGTNRRDDCPYHKDGLCRFWTWDSQDEIPKGIGEPTYMDDEDPGWYGKPSTLYCAMCTIPVEDRVGDIELDALGTPLWGASTKITCKHCGSKGLIAVKIMCTECGHEAYLGFWPKKE